MSTHNKTITQKLALYADILRDVSARGLHYANNVYDRENFRKVQDIALELFAIVKDKPLSEIEPLRDTIINRPAPFPCGDGAVINDEGQILLIRRADNNLWAMPGGGLEVGETPAQGVIREVLEETGVSCEAITLIGIYDSRFCGTTSSHQLYQLSFLCRPLKNIPPIPPPHAHESKEIKWFAQHNLPQDIDPGHIIRIAEAYRVWHGDNQAYFDK